jgi:WhiB family redox-sensing transcriptional regulator
MTGLLLEVPGDWRHRARCRGEDPELFFPTGTAGPVEAQVQAAKAVCAACPVRGECLAWALDAGSDADYGVWGGLDEAERRTLRRGGRRLARDRHGTVACYDANACRCKPCVGAKSASNRRKRLRGAS